MRLYRQSDRLADAHKVLGEIVTIGKKEPAGLTARNQLAADAMATGNTSQARGLIDEVLAANPRDNAALLMRGRLRLAGGDATNAIIDLRGVIRDQPGSPEAAGEPQLAREVLMDALKFQPDNTNLRLLVAADMADTKDYKAAAAEVDKALKSEPQNLRAWEMKAELALAQKDLSGAEKIYASLKTQFPNNPAGSMKLGKFYADQKKYDAALREYDEASKLAPGAAEPVLFGMGILIAQSRFDEASARIEAMGKLQPKSLLPYQLRAEIAAARGDAPQAELAYRKMIEFAPTVPAGYTALARLKAQRNTPAEAIALLEEGERAIPADTSLPALRAEFLARANRADEAIAAYEALVKRVPEDDTFANNLAYLLSESKGDKASLERALALTTRFKDSRNPGYLDSLGWIHYKLARYTEATPLLEQAVKLAPNAPLLQLHLGMVLNKSGDRTRSQEYLKKALDSKATLPGRDEARQLLAQR